MKYTRFKPSDHSHMSRPVMASIDKMAKEQEEGVARTMERKTLDEQDREFFVESELSSIYSRSQYLKILIGGQ